MDAPDNRSGRDARLLALVIVVALAVLLVLAQFRFPAGERTKGLPSPGPLERLTSRSMYDDLAAAIANVVQRTSAGVVIVQLDPIAEPAAAPGRSGRTPPPLPAPLPPPRLVPAIRASQDLAIVHLPPGFAVAGGQGLTTVEVASVHPAHEVAILRFTPPSEAPTALPTALLGYSGFSYVAVLEAALGGPTARPVFVGRVDMVSDDRFPTQVMVPGGTTPVPTGALVYTLDGRFIGLSLPLAGVGTVLVPARGLEPLLLPPAEGAKDETAATGAGKQGTGRGGTP